MVASYGQEPETPAFDVDDQGTPGARLKFWYASMITPRGLIGWATLEASVPLLPVECVLIPLTRSRPGAALQFVWLAAAFSVLGSIYSYALGHFGERMVQWDGIHAANPWADQLIRALDHWGEGLVFMGALLPLPLAIVALAAGSLHIGLLSFLATVAIGRVVRFYLVTILTVHFTKANNR